MESTVPPEVDDTVHPPDNDGEVGGSTADGNRESNNDTDDESSSSTTITDGDHDSGSEGKDGVDDSNDITAGESSDRRAEPQCLTEENRRNRQTTQNDAQAGTGFTLNLSDVDLDDETLNQVRNTHRKYIQVCI